MSKHVHRFYEVTQGISDNDIKRLAYKVGIKRMQKLVYEEIRTIIEVYIETLIQETLIYIKAAKRKTLTLVDVRKSLLALGFDPNIVENPDESLSSFRLEPFEKLVREIARETSNETITRIARAAINLIKAKTEAYIMYFLLEVNLAAEGRKVITKKDIQYVIVSREKTFSKEEILNFLLEKAGFESVEAVKKALIKEQIK